MEWALGEWGFGPVYKEGMDLRTRHRGQMEWTQQAAGTKLISDRTKHFNQCCQPVSHCSG